MMTREQLRKELSSPITMVAIIIAAITTIVGGGLSLYFYNKSEKYGAFFYKYDQALAFDKIQAKDST